LGTTATSMTSTTAILAPSDIINNNNEMAPTTTTATTTTTTTTTPGGVGPVIGSNERAAALSGTSLGPSYVSALSDSFAAVTNAVDHERTSLYVPQNPYPTPASYPALPSQIFDKPGIFEKLGMDALFFIFYYAQGSYQQYLAARVLKKQSWRFRKKYMPWFQRTRNLCLL
jgi:hypothetical protein